MPTDAEKKARRAPCVSFLSPLNQRSTVGSLEFFSELVQIGKNAMLGRLLMIQGKSACKHSFGSSLCIYILRQIIEVKFTDHTIH